MATHSPVFLPGESHGQKNLTGYSLWGRKSQTRLSDDTTTTTIRIGEGNATHCRILVWRIPWTEEPGRLQSMGSQRVGHDRVTNTYTDAHTAFEFLFVLAVLGLCCWSGFSLVAVSGGYCPLRCMGFSLQWLLLLQSTGSRTCGLQ